MKPSSGHPTWVVFIPGIMVLIIASGIVGFVLSSHAGDVSCFILVGSIFTDPSKLPPNITVQSNSSGYDGQFYYRLAIDPFTNQSCDFGICFDNPRYRHQRILYPLLVKLVTVGNISLIPYALLGINLLLLCLISVLGAVYARRQGKHPMLGLFFSLYLGLIFSLLRNLTEITEVFFLLSAVLSLPRNKLQAAILLTLAILARETAVLLATVVLVVACWQRWKGWYWFSLPLVIGGAWQLWILYNWGMTRFPFILRPFVALINLFVLSTQYRGFANIVLITIGVVFTLLTLVRLSRLDTPAFLKIAWLMYTGLLIILGQDVWSEPPAYVRVASEWFILGLMLHISPIMSQRDTNKYKESITVEHQSINGVG